ncbi:hypothetical protein MMC25_000608 [Agyrium rufum]|nr:hypothetical protein [Agyrium rufum]
MDGLSVAASVFAVVGVAVKAARCIERLQELKGLPAVYSLLLEEVFILHEVLTECCTLGTDSAGRAPDKQPLHQPDSSTTRLFLLLQHVQRAASKLEELETAIHANIYGESRKQELKAFWNGLVHGQRRVNKFRDELRHIRLALVVSMSSHTSSAVARIESAVKDASFSQSQVLQVLSSIVQENQIEDDPSPDYTVSSTQESADLCGTLKMTRTLTNSSSPRPTKTRETTPVDKSIARDLKLVDDACIAWCSCLCHKQTSLQSNRIVSTVFGSLCITSHGLPMMTKPCNQHACKRRQLPSMSVTYRFPQALAQRAVSMSLSLSGRGPEVRVKLPRVVNWTAPIWGPAIVGDLPLIRKLFNLGEASPWDVNPIGGSVLHYVADHFNADLCRLLLDAGADPLAEDDCKRIPVEMAWDKALSGNLSEQDTNAVADIFRQTDYLSKRQFSVIHKIVLGLVAKDLRTELECSSSEINAQDTQGRTPLAWAALRGDFEVLKMLLEYGADLHLPDYQLNSPLHYAKTTACAEILLKHGASASVRNCWGATVLHTLCLNSGDASHLLLLLDHGADCNARDREDQTPLHSAIVERRTAFVELLLSRGADVDVKNDSGDSPLRFAIMFNAYDSLRAILDAHKETADFGSINSYGHTFTHSIARAADAKTVEILMAARIENLAIDVNSIDKQGKTSKEYFEEKIQLKGNLDLLQETFERFVEELSAQKGEQDERVFDLLEAVVPNKLDIQIHSFELEGEDEDRYQEDVFYDVIEV